MLCFGHRARREEAATLAPWCTKGAKEEEHNRHLRSEQSLALKQALSPCGEGAMPIEITKDAKADPRQMKSVLHWPIPLPKTACYDRWFGRFYGKPSSF